jgi:uncharacterized protein YchJ
VPDDRTTVTELATALGTLGVGDLASTLAKRPGQLAVADSTWQQLHTLFASRTFDAEFGTAFSNGRAFLEADDALRRRRPRLVEWTGGRRPPGDEVAPVDLRIDHVYLVSCKYLSRNIANPSPARLFDGLLATSGDWVQADWYEVVAPDELRALYDVCRRATGLTDLSDDLGALSTEDRQRLRRALPGRSYPPDARHAYRELCARVSAASAQRWLANVERVGAAERMLWRLLRIGNAAYFLLGAEPRRSLRLRVASSWDWRQAYRFTGLDIVAAEAGQPQVNFSASYVERDSMSKHSVQGHVEVRWSHGRFAQPPEAKVYLDTPTDELPGYFPLERGTSQLGLWD